MFLKQQELFGQVSTMLDAGLSITKALEVASRRGKSDTRKGWMQIIADINNGSSLTSALRSSSLKFSRTDICIIESGEISGHLAESFKLIADLHLMKTQTWNMIISGLAQPVLQFHIIAFLLPIASVILGKISVFHYFFNVFFILFIFMYLPVLVVIGIAHYSGKEGHFRFILDRLLLKIPLLGPALKDLAFARYCQGFYALYNAGIPMPVCADLSLDLCNNVVVAVMLKGGGESARDGYPISQGFSPDTPSDFISLWQTGEQSGRLSDTLQQLSIKQQDRAKENLKVFGKLVPKLIMLAIIFIVALLILSSRA